MRPISRGRLLLALVLSVACAAAASAFAQLSQDPTWRPRIWVGGGRFRRTPPKWAKRENFSVRLAELTNVSIRLDQAGQPDDVVLRLTDPLMSRCSMLRLEDAGTARFTEEEVVALRTYLHKGGFVMVDDFWGTAAWDQWTEEIGSGCAAAATCRSADRTVRIRTFAASLMNRDA